MHKKNGFLIRNASIVNEGKIFPGDVVVEGEKIREIIPAGSRVPDASPGIHIIDGSGKFLLPGIIDDQVHFRDPGLTDKGDIYTQYQP